MIERRKEQRFKKKLLIATMFKNDEGDVVVEDSAYCEDISTGGLRLSFPYKVAKGKVLDLKLFFFADPIHLPAQGKVVWSEKKQTLEVAAGDKKKDADSEIYWVGIQFIDIDVFSRDRIIRWIEKGIDEG